MYTKQPRSTAKKPPFCYCWLLLLFLGTGPFSTSNVVAQPKVEVKPDGGLPSLFVDGQRYPPFAYMSYLGEKEHYKTMAGAGIHLFCVPAYLGERGINTLSGIGPFRKPIWTGYHQYDFTSIEDDFKKVTDADPEALVVVRLYLDPPSWWEKANPDDATITPEGDTFRQSFYSKKWQTETADALKACIRWVSESRFSKNFVGVHVAAGGTEEWFFHVPQRNDKNPQRTALFRDWLTGKYQDNETLQNAWNSKTATIKSSFPHDVGIEAPSDRWREPSNEQHILDTFAFQSETVADNIAYFCEVVKKESEGRLLTGAFYGYHYFLTDPRLGHSSLSRLLECPDLDYLSSPNDYHRVSGEDWPPLAAAGSVRLHGKLWMAENDTRTHLTTLLKEKAPKIAPDGWYDSGVWIGPRDPKTSLSLLWKNAGRMLAYGYGGWWFDMWGGWFDSPELLDVIKYTNKLFTDSNTTNSASFPTEVAVIVDEHLSHYDASMGAQTDALVRARYVLGKTGAPYDLFLRNDIDHITPENYKVVWLLGVLTLSDKESKRIEDLEKSGVMVLRTTNTTSISTPYGEVSGEAFVSPEKLRSLFLKAGVHFYLATDEVVYAGNGWLCLHTVSGGARTVRLPFPANVTDPLKGEVIALGADTINLTLPRNSTTILKVETVR